jgi:hypothetical protein
MRKIICDKCGAEVVGIVKAVKVCYVEGGYPFTRTVDFCESCFYKLCDWLEDEKCLEQ